MESQLGPNDQCEVIKAVLLDWRKKMESHRIGAIVAKKIEDAELEKFNIEQMKKSIVVIETLEAMLKDVSADTPQAE